MLRPARLLALPLALVLAGGAGACGSDKPQESSATIAQPPSATKPATVLPATTTTTSTSTTAPASTLPATTPTTTSTQTGGATPTTPAQSGGAPAGCPSAVGGFVRDVRTSGTDCGVARSVADAWFDAVHEGAAPDGPIDAAGYACQATLAGERASVVCAGSGGSVSFTASP